MPKMVLPAKKYWEYRRYLIVDATKSLFHAEVTSSLDNCKSLLYRETFCEYADVVVELLFFSDRNGNVR